MENLSQKSKVGVAGSFINQMMGNNSSTPKVGEWATILRYTDRSVCKVVGVTKGGKVCRVEHYSAKAANSNSPIGHQDWEFEPTGSYSTYFYRYGAWYSVSEQITFTKEFEEKHKDAHFSFSNALTHEQRMEIYQGDPLPQKVVEGITVKKNIYSKISIIFGKCDYYYDWSF